MGQFGTLVHGCGKPGGTSSKTSKQNYQLIQQLHFWVYSQKKSKRPLYTHVPNMAHESQNAEATQVSTDRRTDKMWHVHTVDCYSDLRRKEIPTQVTMWMSLENPGSSKVSQSQRHKYCTAPLL